MSPDRDRAVGLTGARFGRVARDVEPDEPTGPEHTEPEPEAPEQATPEPSDQAAEPEAAWDEDVDDPPRPTGARFARQPRKRGRSAKTARRAAETGRAPSTEPSPTPPTTPAVPAVPGTPPGAVDPAAAHQATWPAYRPPARAGTEPDEPELDEPDGPDTSVRVRPYIHTGGRTRSRLPLPIESLVTATPGSHQNLHGAHRSVVELCRTTQSVAEVSAKLGVPLGVARVLVDDLAAARAVTVYGETVGDNPDFALMERVLAGLRRL